jgi:hypothetical protein
MLIVNGILKSVGTTIELTKILEGEEDEEVIKDMKKKKKDDGLIEVIIPCKMC